MGAISLNFLIDENMPRSLAPKLKELGLKVQDVRDIGLRGRPDSEVMQVAVENDAILITRDRGFADPRGWPASFTAGAIFVNLPSNTSVKVVNAKVAHLLETRRPKTLLGCLTTVEPRRALSRIIYRR